MDKIYADIVILGGGAAGLCAAIHAARTLKKKNKSAHIIIAEKNNRVGKKLLLTGNGRCNLAHNAHNAHNAHDMQEDVHGVNKDEQDYDVYRNNYHGDSEFALKILKKSKGYKEFFNSLGLYCKIDAEGRVYPYNQSASAVLDALRLECSSLGIHEQTDFNCARIEPLIEGYMLVSKNAYDKNNLSKNIQQVNFISARRLIITCGGMSEADVLNPLRSLGVKIVTPLPALCPIRVPTKLTNSIKKLRATAKCSLILDGKVIGSETGEVQFGDGYLSGICVMNLSRLVSVNTNIGKTITVSLDLTPDIAVDNLIEFIVKTAKIRRLSPIEDLLSGLLHKRLSVLLIKQVTQLPLNRPCECFSIQEAEELAFLIKDWRFPALPYELSKSGWQSAQCTTGGVPASELNEQLMHRRKNGLFIAGETVNVDGDCGGYNLMWAWASGEVAGIAAANDL